MFSSPSLVRSRKWQVGSSILLAHKRLLLTSTKSNFLGVWTHCCSGQQSQKARNTLISKNNELGLSRPMNWTKHFFILCISLPGPALRKAHSCRLGHGWPRSHQHPRWAARGQVQDSYNYPHLIFSKISACCNFVAWQWEEVPSG